MVIILGPLHMPILSLLQGGGSAEGRLDIVLLGVEAVLLLMVYGQVFITQ